MSTAVTWNGTGYTIPAAGELNWASLATFLVALGNSAQATTFQKFAMRVATTTPVTVAAATDCVVAVRLGVAGAVAVSLPAGVSGQVFAIVDDTGDAATNNITITPNSGNINGASTYVINKNNGCVIIAYNGTQWDVIAESNNYIVSSSTSTFTFNGSGGTTGSQTIKWTKVGNVVTLVFPTFTATSGTSSTLLLGNTALPAAIRPAVAVGLPVPIVDNNVGAGYGLLTIGADGVMRVYKDVRSTGTWTNTAANSGIADALTSWVGGLSYTTA